MQAIDHAPELLAGRYQLVQRIGEGGTGLVYRSFDTELEEWVALKLLRPHRADDPEARACLRREVKLARRVTHPNVARVFEFGRDGDQQFLTMEYLPGESLQQLLARAGPLPPDQVADLAIDLCEALIAAHEVGVVHGDLKPGNVMLSPERGAVLTDFGIARALTDPHADHPTLAGTIFYCAPELLRGAPPAPTADLYALGVLLCEALTGATPWSGGDTLQAVADKLAGPAFDPRVVGPELGADWHELLAACLSPSPEARPHDAGALLARVHALRRGAPPRHHEPPATPLGSGPGLRWIAVPRFTSTDPALHNKCAWITADLVQALRRVHALRVVSDGPGPAQGPVVQLRGELHRRADGLRIVVRIAADVDAPADRQLVLDPPRQHLPGVGVELATGVLGALGLGEPHAAVPDLLPAAAIEPYLLARDALLEMRTADAIRHFEVALALAPGHRALRVGHAMARGRHTVLFRSPSSAEFVELRALIEAVTLECSASPEIAMAMGGLLYMQSEPIEAMRWVCSAIAVAPTLSGLCMIGSMLTAIGRLPDAERRLDIAAALERSNAMVWLCRAELAAYQDRWDSFYAIFDGPLAELRIHTVYAAHPMLWHPEAATIERLALAIAEGRELGRPEALRDLAAVVEFLRPASDRPRIFAELAAAHADAPRSHHSRRMHMILCEMACMLGDLPRALALLARADDQALIEWHWLTHSPNLAPLRGDPEYLAVRARVRERADEVSEIVWG